MVSLCRSGRIRVYTLHKQWGKLLFGALSHLSPAHTGTHRGRVRLPTNNREHAGQNPHGLFIRMCRHYYSVVEEGRVRNMPEQKCHAISLNHIQGRATGAIDTRLPRLQPSIIATIVDFQSAGKMEPTAPPRSSAFPVSVASDGVPEVSNLPSSLYRQLRDGLSVRIFDGLTRLSLRDDVPPSHLNHCPLELVGTCFTTSSTALGIFSCNIPNIRGTSAGRKGAGVTLRDT